MRTFLRRICLFFLIVFLAACSSGNTKYEAWKKYRDHMPKSIVVLPPVNDTNELEIADITMMQIPEHLAEAGYYVYSPLVVQDYFRSNGAPSAAEVDQIPYQKIHQVFGADAALHVHITDFTYRYFGISAGWHYDVTMTLIDLHSGEALWVGRGMADNNSSGGNGLIGDAIGALAHMAGAAMSDKQKTMENLSGQALRNILRHKKYGVLIGPRRPNNDMDIRGTVKQLE